MYLLRDVRGRTRWENLVLATIIGILVIVMLLYSQKAMYVAKLRVLETNMQGLRLGIELYRYKNGGRVPRDIRELEDGGYIAYKGGGGIIKEEYVKMVTKDSEGYPVDPFSNRYNYDPETGMIHPSTPGYEDW